MWTKEQWFSGLIRCVFIFAFGAFLWASIHHVATFFHNYEPEGSDWTGSYALAISVDATALVLTIGVMFFGRNMPLYAKFFVWFFIFAMTAFSWVVNWQYARRYQALDLTQDPLWLSINPILASSFAFLNLAYSVIGEFFNARVKTVEELQTELNDLKSRESLEKELREQKEAMRGPGLIERAKNVAIEAKQAVKEVTAKEPEPVKQEPTQSPVIEEVNEPQEETKMGQSGERDTDPIPAVNGEEREKEEGKDLSGSTGPTTGELLASQQVGQQEGQSSSQSSGKNKYHDELMSLSKHYPNMARWATRSQTSMTAREIVDASGFSRKTVQKKIEDGVILATRNPEKLRLDSVIAWLQKTPPPRPKGARETIVLEELMTA